MKNVFERHNVEYLSPSSINKFRRDPAKWLVNIAGYRDTAYSPAMTYGQVIETAITHACMRTTVDVEECIQIAHDRYAIIHKEIHDTRNDLDYDFDADFKKQKNLAKILEYLVPLYRGLGDLEDAQTKVQLDIEEIPIPIIGYADFIYADKVRNMKCTGVMPKVEAITVDSLLFMLWQQKKKPLLDFVYTTTKRCELITLPVTNIEEHIKDVKRIAIKMMRLLSTSSDIHEVARNSYLVPDTTNESS